MNEKIPSVDPVSTKAWKALENHFDKIGDVHMNKLFIEDENRFQHMHKQQGDLLIDYSKNRLTQETLNLLTELAKDCQVEQGIELMFEGGVINRTEGRAVLHTALRNFSGNPVMSEGQDVMPEVQRVFRQMKAFVTDLTSGSREGYTGQQITDVVNIGIGGSDLGPRMVAQALQPYWTTGITPHYVSNIDPTDLAEVLQKVDAESTLFIIASKSFVTPETMKNAQSARQWFLETGAEEGDIQFHFVALSTNAEAVKKFGIDERNMFEFWDWVGGRYSVSSAIGLSVMCAIGTENFEEFLRGLHHMDDHFLTSPLHENVPVILGLIGIWYRNFFGAPTKAILPYDQYLRLLPDYLQQADMESNGKSVSRDNNRVTYNTGAILWGGTGTNAQHSFFQLLHQGTHLVPCDFILPAINHNDLDGHHAMVIANCLAQAEGLMSGKSIEDVKKELQYRGLEEEEIDFLAPHKVFEGNKPSNTIMIRKLTPFTLGQIIALYEHQIFVQGWIWNLYSFDQWGVQLGKELAQNIQEELQGEDDKKHDSSTAGLIRQYRSWMSD